MSCPTEESSLIPQQRSQMLPLIRCKSSGLDPAIPVSTVKCKKGKKRRHALRFSFFATSLFAFSLSDKVLAWQSVATPALSLATTICYPSARIRVVRNPSSFNGRERRVSHHSMIAPQQLGSFEALNFEDDASRTVLLEDWTAGSLVDFEEAWIMQREYLQQQFERLQQQQQQQQQRTNEKTTADSFYRSGNSSSHGVDRVIFLEHQPVYTLGTASDASLVMDTSTNIPIVRMDRGGEVTYHGPGQLTVYPVIDLRHYRQDIHWYEKNKLRARFDFLVWLRYFEICNRIAIHKHSHVFMFLNSFSGTSSSIGMSGHWRKPFCSPWNFVWIATVESVVVFNLNEMTVSLASLSPAMVKLQQLVSSVDVGLHNME